MTRLMNKLLPSYIVVSTMYFNQSLIQPVATSFGVVFQIVLRCFEPQPHSFESS